LYDRNECVAAPKHFPVKSGWIRYPKSPLLDPNGVYVSHDEDSEDDEA
jgi:hypothetical protein